MKIYAVVIISVLNQMAFSGSRVSVSLHALELGANPLSVGVLIACYSLCPLLFSIIIGRFADRTSPRLPVMVSGAAIAAAMLVPLAM